VRTKDRRGQRPAEAMYEAEASGRLERGVEGETLGSQSWERCRACEDQAAKQDNGRGRGREVERLHEVIAEVSKGPRLRVINRRVEA
jgi:hypothetical protein